MKCEVCLELLEEYLDGELSPGDRDEVGAHLIVCSACAQEFAALSAEQELYTHYNREVGISADLWTGVAAKIAPVPERSRLWHLPTAATILLAIGLLSAYIYFRSPSPNEPTVVVKLPKPAPPPSTPEATPEAREVVQKSTSRIKRSPKPIADNSDVISTDLAYLDIEEQETVKHIEQTENLLRSIRNFRVSDTDEEIDVSYDKELSRRLLIENVVLRRDAEMKAKFPTKTLLTDLEPFLIDIANLPDRAKPEEVRAIKERVQKTEIVAALLDYQYRGPNNR